MSDIVRWWPKGITCCGDSQYSLLHFALQHFGSFPKLGLIYIILMQFSAISSSHLCSSIIMAPTCIISVQFLAPICINAFDRIYIVKCFISKSFLFAFYTYLDTLYILSFDVYLVKSHEDAYWPDYLSLFSVSCKHYRELKTQNYGENWLLWFICMSRGSAVE